MVLRIQRDVLSMLLLGCVAGASCVADETQTAEMTERKQPFAIRLVDEEGKPVAGAIAGIIAYFGNDSAPASTLDETKWSYEFGQTSDAQGVARFTEGRDALGHCCIIARHVTRRLICIAKVDPDKLDSELPTGESTLALHPECRVTGALVSSDFEKRGRKLGWTNLYLSFAGNRALACEPSDQIHYHFFLPPGEFTLEAYGEYLHWVSKTFTVRRGERELQLDPIDLPPTRLALLQGEFAPELHDVLVWKNGPAVNLADLRGKVVVLDFWGYWCGPYVHSMPELFELHDRYHKRGLAIVGIHVDLGEHETEQVDTPEKLDQRLVNTRKRLWKGKDIPYPVALVSGKRVPFGPATASREARGAMAAEYGVTG